MGEYDKLYVSLRMTIMAEDDGALGKGVVTLLKGILEKGSLNQAAKSIGMAYSKAWRIVKETEAGFGFLLINRDGARGSTLTKEGKQLVEMYENLQKELEDYANTRFKEEVSKLES
ncbi:MAG: winged helix-turn-helix domain-containing protein [Coriobacteriales bacterium]|jgi:molybdate transport system regulatory protein